MKKPLVAWLFAFKPDAVFGLLRRRLAKSAHVDARLGVELLSVGNGVAEARLPVSRRVTGAEGVVQRAAVFALADAAAAAAVAGAFAPVIGETRTRVASVAVTFHAETTGDLAASAMAIGSSLDLRAFLKEDDAVDFDVVVDVRAAGDTDIAQLIYAWRAEKAPPASAALPAPEAADTAQPSS